jgi:RHH-type proline utilization regulon transcriptional repressor/proline dehydrogenase/delta 1-pyrroline-5-carboxylate dehydrogenase
VYPQFATHNAATIAAIAQMAARSGAAFELQRLHGMGEGVYAQVLKNPLLKCRVYAPVGGHRDLLAYLVRRLLENGANTSFVNQIVDPAVDLERLVADPVALTLADGGTPHPAIPLPEALLPGRLNSCGVDLADEIVLAGLAIPNAAYHAGPLLVHAAPGRTRAVINPANPRDHLGTVTDTGLNTAAADAAFDATIEQRAGMLEAWAAALEAKPGTPGLKVVRSSFDGAGRVVEYDEEYWRHDAVRIHVDIEVAPEGQAGVRAAP